MNKTIPTLALAVLMSTLAGANLTYASGAPANISSNLMMGSNGNDVVTLQMFLESNGNLVIPAGVMHGYFGPATQNAVMAYQRLSGIPATGFVGAMTRAKIASGMMTTPAMTTAVPTTDTKAAGLRVLLSVLEHQHVDLASAAVRSGFDGRPDFTAAAAELDKNSVELSKAVGSIYGTVAANNFLAIWRSHIGFFVDYTVAAKKGDKAGMDKAVANLGGYVDGISDFFSGANPNLPREAVHQLVSAHVALLKAAVDTYGAGDYAGSYAKQTEASTQIGSISDAISGAIVKQYPEKF